ncbi:uncharacterized protein FIBRA_06122 [Fibroporia radiculosa]|uniref:NAD-dependent epimerase/dehydratase domain-containing protein n=1 Tax=Fibroporia radiculosa TaxID=599839 RepID=J4IB34_9APHY|nr:uncharacterized protein FIBRA_06122 [Fibroporia radiculosa]CCM03966.1 predicted protein [Fibroporia radiculosa]
MSRLPQDDLYLVTGGNGFIGHHVARRLHLEGYRVRITDIGSVVYSDPWPPTVEVILGNLCDPSFCAKVANGVSIVLHFAANMGGMGVIHTENDIQIYQENHSMTLNLISASLAAGVCRFFYASSACVYPELLQGTDKRDVSLRESDVWAHMPPSPQGLYGLEKLHGEQLLHQYAGELEIRIARFHNIYGPEGCWSGGREKAPAALLRKAHAAARSGFLPAEIEIWGDGSQRRSFCFIDDAVEGILLLLRSNCNTAVNIGSERSSTIKELADLASQCAGLDSRQVFPRYIAARPVGVGSRNSNNDLARGTLDWTPSTSLEDGMRRTGEWIRQQMDKQLLGKDDAGQSKCIREWQNSEVVHLQSDVCTFAILLPITSRGRPSPGDCLDNLLHLSRSLRSTTLYDTGRSRYRLRIYIAIDHDDHFLYKGGGYNKPESVLRSEGFQYVETLISQHPHGHVCALWRDCARKAWKDKCDYFVLMGDDVTLQDQNWMSAVCDAFAKIASEEHVPEGFGCVAFSDNHFPECQPFQCYIAHTWTSSRATLFRTRL